MVTLSRRQALKAGTAAGALSLWPTAVLLDGGHRPALAETAGTTLESTLTPAAGSTYRRLTEAGPWQQVLRTDLVEARRVRTDRRTGLATLVQVSDLHVTDIQNPMRFEYIDRINSTGHRPQELLGLHGTAALVRRINGLRGGAVTGRPVDVVMSTGDNTDNQAGTELEWLLTLLAGGLVTPDSGAHDGFEGVQASGLDEYWQPENPDWDRYKDCGFPYVPGLIEASTRPFLSVGLAVPWLLTMGNHDVVANGMLENREYVEQWSTGGRKIFSAHCDATLQLAARLEAVRAGDDVSTLMETIARAGTTRSVTADLRRLPYTGREYVDLLHDDRFTGAGPVGHGYAAGAGADQLYFSHLVAPGVVAISIDSTNQAGGIEGSIGAAQWAWLDNELKRFCDHYVLVFSHHPSDAMTNLAPDPRTPGERRYGGDQIAALLHRHPQVLAWVNGHAHKNKITPHPHADPRRSFWEINSASHIDAPQQARMIEVVTNGDGTVSLVTTMVDADAPARAAYDAFDPVSLASLYRELAYNDPAYRDRRGLPRDRNAELLLVDPLPA